MHVSHATEFHIFRYKVVGDRSTLLLLQNIYPSSFDICHEQQNQASSSMSLSFLVSLTHRLAARWPMLFYAATWTAILTVTVAVASFSPEFAFVSAISATSLFSQECRAEGTVRIPLDLPGEIMCFPAHLFMKSKIDLIIPPVFAAVMVTGSAWVVRSAALLEHDEAR